MQRQGRPTQPDGLVIEAWGQGLMIGSLLIMSAITVSNMKKHILLHKLILAEAGHPIYPDPEIWQLAIRKNPNFNF
ncbi:hypothetical protein N7454_008430 [Penicillium verhagenii]|nr:hypothetical protein N7454_008430 [Penicillium verhagenii]